MSLKRGWVWDEGWHHEATRTDVLSTSFFLPPNTRILPFRCRVVNTPTRTLPGSRYPPDMSLAPASIPCLSQLVLASFVLGIMIGKKCDRGAGEDWRELSYKVQFSYRGRWWYLRQEFLWSSRCEDTFFSQSILLKPWKVFCLCFAEGRFRGRGGGILAKLSCLDGTFSNYKIFGTK